MALSLILLAGPGASAAVAQDDPLAGIVAALTAPLVVLGAPIAAGTELATTPSAPPGCENASIGAAELALRDVRAALACLVNAQRASDGLTALARGGSLQRTATGHSKDMVRRRFFSHSSPSGSTLLTRVRRTGYLRRARRWSLGEALAYGRGDVTASTLFRALMASPSHRAVLRDGRYRQLGVGLQRGVPEGTGAGLTVTLDFAVRR